MKFVICSLILVISLLASVITRSQTNDPFTEENFIDPEISPRMVRVHAEFIEMPHPTYTALMAAPRTSTNDSDLRAQCAKLIEQKEARIIESLAVTALPNQYTATEGISEFVYPTEYEPSDFIPLPHQIGDLPLRSLIGGPPVPPVAFDTKNIGSTLKVEVRISKDSKLIDLRLTPTIVYHTGDEVWNSWTNGEVTIDSSTPRFYVIAAKVGANLITGQPLMISTHSPQDEKGIPDPSRKIMLFVRADIITLDQ